MSTEPVAASGQPTASWPDHQSRPLVGRADELAALARLMSDDRPGVINVTGVPGVGKSALVRAAVREVGHLVGVVDRLDLTGEPPDRVLDALREHLDHLAVPLPRSDRGNRTLLVVDRADALTLHGREMVALAVGHGSLTILLESVPQVRAADCPVVLLGPLGADAATAVFRGAAASVGVRIAADAATEASVRRICDAVDGNPLALELAATRLPSLPLARLAEVLATPHSALSVLSSAIGPDDERAGMRTALHAAQQASSLAAQRLLDLLSVFTGPFSVEAAEAVSQDVVTPCYDALAELLDLRLLDLDPDSGGDRYRLSRLVRGFAVERLEASDLAPGAHDRHARHYADLARRAARAVEDADDDTARAVLGPDYAEALTAVRRLSDADPGRALRLAADLGWEAHRRGAADPLADTLERLWTTVPAAETATRRDALLWWVQIRSWGTGAGDRTEIIRRRMAEAMALARELGEPLPLLRALRVQFLAVIALGDVRAAMDACEEGIERASALGHVRWTGRFEISLSSMRARLREFETAAALARSGLARAQRSGDRRAVVLASLVLHGLPPETRGGAALPPLEAVLEITRELGDTQNETHVLATLAHDAVERGEAVVAARWTLARQEHLGRSELIHGLTVSVMLAVHVAQLRGDLATGARLHGAVAAHMAPLLPTLAPAHAELYREAVESLRDGLGADEFDRLVAAGGLLDRDETLEAMTEYLRDEVLAAVAPAGGPVPHEAPAPELTPRQLQVLRLIVEGRRNKEIALELRLTPKSVMHHTVAIYRRLGVRGRAEAAATAARLGLVPDS